MTLSSAVTDTGPGVFTMMRQIVAEELKVPLDSIRVRDARFKRCDQRYGRARQQQHTGARELCSRCGTKAAARNFAHRGTGHERGPDELILYDGGVTHGRAERRMSYAEIVSANGGPLVAEGHYVNMAEGPEASLVAQVAEVEVDSETGEVRVRELTTAHNTGRILNPLTHQGQIDGAVVMGLGYGIIENSGLR